MSLALLLTDTTLDVRRLIGFVTVMAPLAKNAVLLDSVNRARRGGAAPHDAAADASATGD